MKPRDTGLNSRLIVALARGATWTEAAAEAGCCRSVVARRMRDTGFLQAVEEARRALHRERVRAAILKHTERGH
jgi:hypothetical protein